MRFVIQRVDEASVRIEGQITASIGKGFLILMGIHREDTEALIEKAVDRILKLRIFADAKKPINASLAEVDGEILLVSQFTLYGDCKGQNRPSFIEAARPEIARPIYDKFVVKMKNAWPKTKTGEFAADMKVASVNDGPVTILMET